MAGIVGILMAAAMAHGVAPPAHGEAPLPPGSAWLRTSGADSAARTSERGVQPRRRSRATSPAVSMTDRTAHVAGSGTGAMAPEAPGGAL